MIFFCFNDFQSETKGSRKEKEGAVPFNVFQCFSMFFNVFQSFCC